jgi:hypothetical protein
MQEYQHLLYRKQHLNSLSSLLWKPLTLLYKKLVINKTLFLILSQIFVTFRSIYRLTIIECMLVKSFINNYCQAFGVFSLKKKNGEF